MLLVQPNLQYILTILEGVNYVEKPSKAKKCLYL